MRVDVFHVMEKIPRRRPRVLKANELAEFSPHGIRPRATTGHDEAGVSLHQVFESALLLPGLSQPKNRMPNGTSWIVIPRVKRIVRAGGQGKPVDLVLCMHGIAQISIDDFAQVWFAPADRP